MKNLLDMYREGYIAYSEFMMEMLMRPEINTPAWFLLVACATKLQFDMDTQTAEERIVQMLESRGNELN